MTRMRPTTRRLGGVAGPAAPNAGEATQPIANPDAPAPEGGAVRCCVIMRRRVSLAGHVWRGAELPASSGAVRLMAIAIDAPGAAMLPDQMRCREASIRADGRYFFLDLPSGDYAVTGHAGTGRRAMVLQGRTVSVPAADRRRPPPLTAVDLVVEPGPSARDGVG
jgi:hypothetical protein